VGTSERAGRPDQQGRADDVPAPTLGQELTRLRKAHGLTLRALAPLVGLNAHSRLADYERDYRIPPADLLTEYQRVLRADGATLQRLRRQALDDRDERRAKPGSEPRPDPRPESRTGPDAVRAAAQRARDFGHRVPAPLDDEPVEQFRDDLRGLAGEARAGLSGTLLAELAATQDRLFGLLDRPQAPSAAVKLYWLAAAVGGLLGRFSLAAGEPAAASAQAHTAFVCADRAGDDTVRAWVRGIQALIAYAEGRFPESVRYAQAGGLLARRLRGSVAAWLPAREAVALARLGNADRADAAVRLAERAWARLRPDELDELGGPCRTGRAELDRLLAEALRHLPGRAADAERHARAAVAGQAEEDREQAARARLLLAELLTERPDRTRHRAEIADLLDGVRALPAEARTPAIARRLAVLG
jgi:transcriptional regulator with XRE-family HTH domain